MKFEVRNTNESILQKQPEEFLRAVFILYKSLFQFLRSTIP